MKTLSIFVDESGDLGLNDRGKTFYIVSLVFHDQNYDISRDLDQLDSELLRIKAPKGAVHTEPLIRREAPYEAYTPNERRTIFSKLFFFAKKCEISYKSFIFEKQQFNEELMLEARIARDISQFVKDNLAFFQTYDEVVLYYDNGQKQLNRVLNTVLATELVDYEVRKVKPSDYRLFQVADLICTIELLNKKIETGQPLSRSEQLIFHSVRDFKKDFLKKIRGKSFLD